MQSLNDAEPKVAGIEALNKALGRSRENAVGGLSTTLPAPYFSTSTHRYSISAKAFSIPISTS